MDVGGVKVGTENPLTKPGLSQFRQVHGWGLLAYVRKYKLLCNIEIRAVLREC